MRVVLNFSESSFVILFVHCCVESKQGYWSRYIYIHTFIYIHIYVLYVIHIYIVLLSIRFLESALNCQTQKSYTKGPNSSCLSNLVWFWHKKEEGSGGNLGGHRNGSFLTHIPKIIRGKYAKRNIDKPKKFKPIVGTAISSLICFCRLFWWWHFHPCPRQTRLCMCIRVFRWPQGNGARGDWFSTHRCMWLKSCNIFLALNSFLYKKKYTKFVYLFMVVQSCHIFTLSNG